MTASLTVPSLTRSYQKQTWVSGYKEAYSIINQAARMMAIDNSTDNLFNFIETSSGNLGMLQKFEPYFKVAKFYPKAGGASCMASSYKFLNGNNLAVYTDDRLALSNGMCFSFYNGATFKTVTVDINGKKGPNVLGKDLHYAAYVRPDHPSQFKPYLWDSLEVNPKCNSTLTGTSGQTCGTRILRGDYGADY